MSRSTKLSTIINRMDRYQAIQQNSNSATKVRDIDEQIRSMRRLLTLPWQVKKSTLRVFDGVLTYAPAVDHDELAYVDVSENVTYPAKARFRYTSLVQFFEDSTNRNTLAEIWDGGERKLGVNLKSEEGNQSQILNSAEVLADFTVTGDSGTPVLDTVIYKEGAGSIKVPVTLATGVAGVRNSITMLSDTDYKSKYHFKRVYLSGLPSSIDINLETNASNYLWTNVTTQFDGTPFKAGQWNLIAQDLNAAGETGTFDPTLIAYERVIFYDAPTGDYRIDTSSLKQWTLLDYWYYSIYAIKTAGATSATKEYFYDDDSSGDAYVLTDELLGDSEWIDVIMYGACLNQVSDIKDKDLAKDFGGKLAAAYEALTQKYPELSPVTITDRWNFVDDFISPNQ